MMGQHERTESLFYYFRLEDQIPEDHLLRLIDQYVDLSFVRERLKPFYSSTGRPSIDPEVLLRLLLIGYLYGITSERRLLEEVKMHLAYRWFTRLQANPDVFMEMYGSVDSDMSISYANPLYSGMGGIPSFDSGFVMWGYGGGTTAVNVHRRQLVVNPPTSENLFVLHKSSPSHQPQPQRTCLSRRP